MNDKELFQVKASDYIPNGLFDIDKLQEALEFMASWMDAINSSVHVKVSDKCQRVIRDLNLGRSPGKDYCEYQKILYMLYENARA